MDDALNEWVWHDPACPFAKHCYCGNDGEAPPHDKIIKRPTIKALSAIYDLEAALQAAQARIEALEGAVTELLSIGPAHNKLCATNLPGGEMGYECKCATGHAKKRAKAALEAKQ